MGAPAYRGRRRERRSEGEPDRSHRIGKEALHFGRWFAKSKFALMEGFLGEIESCGRDADELRARFLAATRHAKRVLVARGFVTTLLALGVIATASAGVAERWWIPTLVASDVASWAAILGGVAAIAGSATVALLVARLAFDRYLELVDTTATFLAIEMAACSAEASAASASTLRGRRGA